MNKFKFSEEMARQIEDRYHEMYKVSDEWVQSKLDEAKNTGYVTCAFGLRLRTPLLATKIDGKQAIQQTKKEARSAGNALGQSWCLLNTRAVNAVMEKVWNSPYKIDILPVAQIHDASYYFIKDDINVLMWLNNELIKEMKWQEDPLIQHDKVKLGGELDVYYPSWAHPVTIPNNATKEEIMETINASKK